jgi:23S rRNA (cytidine1920-2'-O)/16S rRNA (cytidine1409-2'-O)-methyltransferase
MVKPQFEVGRARLGRGGVVREPALRAEAVLAVARLAHQLGWGTAGVARSPLPGPSGNVEFFLWLRKDAGPPDPASIEAGTTEPAGTQPAGTTEPAGTEPAGTEPAGTEPAGTEPAGTEAATAMPSAERQDA